MKYLARILFISIVVIVFAHLLTWLLDRTSLLEGFNKSISEFDITDIYYSNRFGYSSMIDTNVVIVNFGFAGRGQITEMINIINKYQPNSLVLDAVFNSDKDSITDLKLETALSKVVNLIMPNGILSEDSGKFYITSKSKPRFTKNATLGHANLNIPASDKAFGNVRSFLKQMKVEQQNRDFEAMDLLAVKAFDPDLHAKIIKRSNNEEYIHFKGYWFGAHPSEEANSSDNILLEMANPDYSNAVKYLMLDVNDILRENFVNDAIKDKIVIMGLVAADIYDDNLEDKYYTPLNTEILGRSNPDMYVLNIHANIISMMLDGKMIYSREWLNVLFSLAIGLLSVAFYKWIYSSYNNRYQLFSKIALIIELNVIIASLLVFYHYTLVRIDPRWLLFYLLFVPDAIEILESTKWFKKLFSEK